MRTLYLLSWNKNENKCPIRDSFNLIYSSTKPEKVNNSVLCSQKKLKLCVIMSIFFIFWLVVVYKGLGLILGFDSYLQNVSSIPAFLLKRFST